MLGIGLLVVKNWQELCMSDSSFILHSNKIQHGNILVPAYPSCRGKWPLNEHSFLSQTVWALINQSINLKFVRRHLTMLSGVLCLSDVCPSDVCHVHPVGGRRVWPAGWIARIGWSGPARPAWLKAAHARFHCRPGRGHIVVAAHLHLVIPEIRPGQSKVCQRRYS